MLPSRSLCRGRLRSRTLAFPNDGGPTVPTPAELLERAWQDDPRWRGVQRDYSAADVIRLRGSWTPACTP